jgi:hypothetical protein
MNKIPSLERVVLGWFFVGYDLSTFTIQIYVHIIQKGHSLREGEFCPFECVFLRVDGVVACMAEIGVVQVGFVEKAFREIAALKIHSLKISLSKIYVSTKAILNLSSL